jgi:hypothetical protein
MLFMVIERYKNGDPSPVYERFRSSGRMLPDGLTYLASWVDVPGSRCFQLMESSDASTLDVWTARWTDLVDFEIVPVVTSAEAAAQVGTLPASLEDPPD